MELWLGTWDFTVGRTQRGWGVGGKPRFKARSGTTATCIKALPCKGTCIPMFVEGLSSTHLRGTTNREMVDLRVERRNWGTKIDASSSHDLKVSIHGCANLWSQDGFVFRMQ